MPVEIIGEKNPVTELLLVTECGGKIECQWNQAAIAVMFPAIFKRITYGIMDSCRKMRPLQKELFRRAGEDKHSLIQKPGNA